MYIQFLGTNAGIPILNRNVSSIALILNDYNKYEIWLFDCGEGTQKQILNTSIKLTKINKIFITHLHGDHIFGLLGLLNSKSIVNNNSFVEIYGPKGIKKFINLSLNITNSFISFSFKIIEINEGEILNNDFYKVDCFLLNHTLPCYGFRIKQHDRVGSLNVKKLIKDGITPGPIYKELKLGKKIYFNKKIINGNNYLKKKTKGKNIAILGDTSPLLKKCNYLFNLDLLIYESTLDHSMKKKANLRGHSTNIQAVLLAKKYFVKKLILTHFSSRYNNSKLNKILKECYIYFKNVYLAKDFYIFNI